MEKLKIKKTEILDCSVLKPGDIVISVHIPTLENKNMLNINAYNIQTVVSVEQIKDSYAYNGRRPIAIMSKNKSDHEIILQAIKDNVIHDGSTFSGNQRPSKYTKIYKLDNLYDGGALE